MNSQSVSGNAPLCIIGKMASSDSSKSSGEFVPFAMEGGGNKLMRKTKENPVLSAGIFGGLGVLAYMAYGLRHKPKTEKLSVYLIHTRLGVQGTVIGALTCAMVYHLFREQVEPRYQHFMEEHNFKKKD